MNNEQQPILIDWFCSAGGTSVGYARAGFDVVGCDIKPQPRYPFDFLQMDVLDALRLLLVSEALRFGDTLISLADVAAHGARPPCQFYTRLPGDFSHYPDLIRVTREMLVATSKPYAIEKAIIP